VGNHPALDAAPKKGAREGAHVEDDLHVDRESRENEGLALRLAIGRDGLGIELGRPASVACLDVTELVVRMPQVRFPFNVSGGIAKFRNKRGELERVTIELDTRKLVRWAEPRLRGLVTAGRAAVRVDARRLGATMTVFESTTAGSAKPTTDLAALAFEVTVTTHGDDVVAIVHRARGANLPDVATALAIRAAAALFGNTARREGSRFIIRHPAITLVRHLLPEAGVRAPSGANVRLSGSGQADGALVFAFVRDAVPVEIDAAAILASETAQLLRQGDDARFSGDLERARALDLACLERAPRHPDVAYRIAEIDAIAKNRAEAALATLREAGGERAPMGTLAGALHLETGDVTSAIAALLHAAEREPANIVSALTYAAAARATRNPLDGLAWLDAAIARAPRIAELRWERARRRLSAGRLADARADLQELEALAEGSREREDVLRRGADLYREKGLGDAAADLYERALLYRPNDPSSLAGLGSALAREGRAARGAALLAHAIQTANACGQPTTWMDLELARILSDRLQDRPAAIARLRAIPDSAPEAIAARGLEGRLRAVLGDFAGASLAFARMREQCDRNPSAVPWLVEAATYEFERGELLAAQQHAGAALAVAPHDESVLALYKDIGTRIAESVRIRDVPAPHAESKAEPAAPAPSAPEEPIDEGAAEERIESLTRAVQADPSNDAIVDELVRILSRLGRGMELLALLSARLEDAPPERRRELLPKHREVLAQLEGQARSAGRDGEADLFKMALEASNE